MTHGVPKFLEENKMKAIGARGFSGLEGEDNTLNFIVCNLTRDGVEDVCRHREKILRS